MATLLAVLLGTALLVLLPTVPASAAESMTLAKTSTDNVLVGANADVTLTATNNGSVGDYNLSFRDQLPAGVTYVAGSTAPVALGEPTVITGGTPARQTLVWSDVSDLPAGAAQALRFKVAIDPATYPVGSTVSNTAQSYANSDVRTVPKFDATGAYLSGATVQATSGTAQTKVSAIQVTKTEPSPEHELVRGVHDHPTTYTLTVTNNGAYADTGAVLVDYLPAQLEFLGCGTADNTPGGAVEYPGAVRLDASTPDVASCVTPYAVDTVTIGAGDSTGYPAGVYTRVEWRLGSLAASAVRTVVYAAGIPQRANTTTFPAGRPSATSLGQGANLDNNTGASTRETGTEPALTNQAQVSATYAGPVAAGTSTAVTDTDALTVTAEDLAMQKSVSPTSFTQGQLATYTLSLEGSEYVDSSDIVITDTLPDGLCPVEPGVTFPDADAECSSSGASSPTVAFAASRNANGTWTLTFDPVALAQNGTRTTTYQARMRSTYGAGSLNGQPTAANDSFTNIVTLQGTTTPLSTVASPDSGPQTVGDDSKATLMADPVTLDKRIQPWTSTPYTCSTSPDDYQNPSAAASAARPYVFPIGSRVCFTIRVQFPSGSNTKNPVVSDFLPANLTYESGSAAAMPDSTASASFNPTSATFTVGDAVGSNRFAGPGQVFDWRIAGTVTSAPTGSPDLPGNLAKLQYTNTAGTVSFLRDAQNFTVPPTPPVGIAKSAARTSPTPGALPVGSQVRAGDVVAYTVGLTNQGTAANLSDIAVYGPDAWDLLPPGIPCSAVSAISDGGTCSDPTTSTTAPNYTGKSTRGLVRWNLDDSVSIAPGATRSLTYTVTYPATVSATRSYTNDAYVASYATQTDTGSVVQHYPASNVDTGVPAASQDVPAAHATHRVVTPNAGVTKSNVTSTDDTTQGPNPAALHYVTLGEQVTYTVTGTAPAKTTVYRGVLSDDVPAGLRIDSVDFAYRDDPTSAFGALPGGFSATSPTPTVTFPASLDTGAADDQVRMTIHATVTNSAALVQGSVITNRATLASTTESGTANTTQSTTSAVTVVEPSPSPTKSASPTSVGAGQSAGFTVTARDVDPALPDTRRPTLFDAAVVDCVPAGMTVTQASIAVSAGTAAVGAVGSNGCAATATPIVWTVGDLAWRSTADASGGNPWPTLTYAAVVDPTAAGGASYTNTVAETGTSMSGANADERSYSTPASAVVTVPGATTTKSVTPLQAPVGSTVTYTLVTTLPANVNFYDATIVDVLPAGIEPATVHVTGSSCQYAGGGTATTCGTAVSDSTQQISGQTHGWVLDAVPSDPVQRTLTVTYTATVGVVAGNIAGQPLANQAKLSWNSTDRAGQPGVGATFDQSSNTATATTTVTEPSLTIAKSVDNTTPMPGDTFTYTVKVTNGSGANVSAAQGVTVVDTVPSGVVPTAGTITGGGTFDAATRQITWTDLGPIARGAVTTLTYQATLTSPPPTTAQTNTADITQYFSLPGHAGRTYDGPTSSATVTPGLPHLTMRKTVLDGPPSYLGQGTRWQLTITNTGPAVAHDVDAADVLPSGWTYDAGSARVAVAGAAATAVEPSVSGTTQQTLTFTDLADLASGQTTVVVLSATPGAGLAPDHVGAGVAQVNNASTQARDLDGGAVVTTATSQAQTHVDADDLVLDKNAVGTPVAGQSFSWTLDVSNTGPDTAVGPFTVTDTLPSQVTGATAAGTGWSCSTDANAATITCQRTAGADTLASGAAFPRITVTASVPAGLAPGTTLANSARVVGRTYDTDATDSTDQTSDQVAAVSDMGITKALSGALVPGSDATYTIGVTNNGPSVSRGPITVTDTLPSSLTFVSSSGTGWTLARSGQTLTFTYTGGYPVALGALPQLSVTVAVASSTTASVTNAASVTEPTDPTSGPEAADSDSVTATPSTRADLGILKDSITDFRAGTQGTYRMTVHDYGPSDAAGPLTVTDTLPASLTYRSVSSADGWSCAANGRALTCTRAAGLAVTTETSFDVTVDIDPALAGGVQNTAAVRSATTDPISSNDSSTDDTGIDVRADLGITKSLDTATVVAGGDVSYTLRVHDYGPANSQGSITVVDTLPAGLSYLSAGGTGWTCPRPSGQQITCTHAAGLTVGTDAEPIVVSAHVASGLGTTTVPNVATVRGTATDPNLDNDQASRDTPVTEQTEISVAKVRTSANPVVAGEQTTFDITVSDTGVSDARAVSVSDLLPAGMSLVSIGGTGWTCAGSGCTIDRVVAGTTSEPITVVATVGSSVADGSTLTNTATVSTTTPGDTNAGNQASADVDVVARADLRLVKAHPGGPTSAGETTSFTIDVTNLGPSDAVGPITVVDTLPVGMTYVSASAPWSCAPGAVTQSGQVVTCTLLPGSTGLLASTGTPQLALQVLIDSAAPVGSLQNSATVSSGTTDPASANNTGTADVVVQHLADLSVVKTQTSTAHIGDPLSWQLSVHNAGPSTARDVVVTDPLPSGLDFVSATGAGWSCASAAGTVTCTLQAPLAPAANAEPITLVTTVAAAAYPAITNAAQVTSSTPEADPTDNTGVDAVAVPALVSLSVAKSHTGALVVGSDATYRIAVTNTGPTPDPGPITVSDPLPTGLAFVSGSGDGFGCQAVAQVVTCVRTDPLAVGASATVSLDVTVLAAAWPSVTNTATVASDAEETGPRTATAADVGAVTPTVVLDVDKKVVSVTDDTAVFSIAVTNRGPSATVGATLLRDPMPDGLDLVRVSGDGWSCTTAQRLASCAYAAPIASGQTVGVRVVTTITAAAGTTITNVATANGGAASAPDSDGAAVLAENQTRHHHGSHGDNGDQGGNDNGDNGGHNGTDHGGNGDHSGTSLLPDTGGPALWILALGLLLIALGGGLVASRRRPGSHRSRRSWSRG